MTEAQRKLNQAQIERFYTDGFSGEQAAAFTTLTKDHRLDRARCVVDIGGGQGHFAATLAKNTGLRVRVLDTDLHSVEACRSLHQGLVEAICEDACAPVHRHDEEVVCFNLVLHHLVSDNEKSTRALQQKALKVWLGQARFIFVNEYVYDSFVAHLSGRLIYEITRSKALSAAALVVSKILPTLRANTFGVGVRFRARTEWIALFEEAGFELVGQAPGRELPVSLPRRLLLIDKVRRDSFLLRARAT